jgi:hypothetical protein
MRTGYEQDEKKHRGEGAWSMYQKNEGLKQKGDIWIKD